MSSQSEIVKTIIMRTPLYNELTATHASSLMAHNSLSAEALARSCLGRVALREPTVGAWATIDTEHVVSQAKTRDTESRRSPLHGIPVAIKDVLDTADLPTQMGSPIYAGHCPQADASVVAQLRAAGAVIMGKTVTAEFAGMAPSSTRNPHNPAHTPGGSSSGSGAAVADFMVPIAFGTQTGGSVQRPASYCGVFGFKPTYGRINRAGVKFAAESLDTIGWMARSLLDIALVDAVLTDADTTPLQPMSPNRIGLCRTYLWEKAESATRDAIEEAVTKLRAAGIRVDEVGLPADFNGLTEAREIINDYERARALAYEWNIHRELISPQLTRSITRGYQIPHIRYVEACRYAERVRIQFDQIAKDYDALLAPCVQGEAPKGLEYAGDPSFQSLWTLLHVPTIGLPTHRGLRGLPVSIQLVGARYADSQLMRVALAVWNELTVSDTLAISDQP